MRMANNGKCLKDKLEIWWRWPKCDAYVSVGSVGID